MEASPGVEHHRGEVHSHPPTRVGALPVLLFSLVLEERSGAGLLLRGSFRGIMSRVRMHPWAETFHGSWAGVKRPGFSWPSGHPLTFGEDRHGPVERDGTGGAFLGLPSAPYRLPPSCHPRDSGLAAFHGSPLSLGHARPRALWSARGLCGPDFTLGHPMYGYMGRPAGDLVDSDPRPGCATPPGHLHAPFSWDGQATQITPRGNRRVIQRSLPGATEL